MRRTPAVRAAAVAGLLLAAAAVVHLLQAVPPPDDAVADLAEARLTATADLTAGTAPSPQAAAALRRTVAALGSAPRHRAADINWALARQWRAVTADRIRLTMQAVPDDGVVLLRLTADPLPGASPDAVARAAAIRALRGRAYALPAAEAGALVGR